MKSTIKSAILSAFTVLLTFQAQAQVKIGNNPTVRNADSELEVESTNRGLLLPRVALTSTTSFAPLSAHVQGMVVYNTATAGDVVPAYYYNDGTKWVQIAAATASTTEPWYNVATNAGATSNTQDLYSLGSKWGLGTATPSVAMDVVIQNPSADNFHFTSYGATPTPAIRLRSAEGTLAAPDFVKLNGQAIGGLIVSASKGTVSAFQDVSSIRSYATENHSATGYGANLVFFGTQNGTTQTTERMILEHNGNGYGGLKGTSHTMAADSNSFAWGSYNRIYGHNSLVAGFQNVDSSRFSTVLGWGNSLGPGGGQTNRGVILSGGGNVVTAGSSYNSIINGSQVNVYGDCFESIITGYQTNVSSSQKVVVSGQGHNVSNATGSAVFGNFSTVSAPSALVTGSGNTINAGASYGIALGESNTVAANHLNSMAIGKSATTTASGQLAANFAGGYKLSGGNVTIPTMATGAASDNIVTVDATGVLNKVAASTLPNIFNTNGTLTSERTLTTTGAYNFSIKTAAPSALLFAGAGGNTSTNNRIFMATNGLEIQSNEPTGTTPVFKIVTGSGGFVNDRMTILQNGNVGIGTNAPTANLHVTGSTLASAWTTSSDARLKINIVGLGQGTLSKVMQLKAVSYEKKENLESTVYNIKETGFIAQDLRKIFPNMVQENGKDKLLSVNYTALIPVLTKAVQELKQENDDLKQEVAQLKAQMAGIASLAAQVKELQALVGNNKAVNATEASVKTGKK